MYQKLIVWQKSMDLLEEVYKISKQIPLDERFSLTQQMRKCAISIPSNIAEGRRRISKKDYRYFLIVSFGSGAELETQIAIAQRLHYLKEKNTKRAKSLLVEVMRMLNAMIRKFS